MQEGLSLEKAHVISEEAENRIKERFKDLELITVHVGLTHRQKTRIAIPIKEDKGMNSSAVLHFGSAPYFAFIDLEEGQIMSLNVRENEGATLSHKKGIHAANLLIEEKVDVVLAGSLGEGPFHVLGDNLIQIYYLPKFAEIREAVRLLNQNLLEKMLSPTEKPEEEKIE
jgi:predicted Fe-Mo cluster-binding NifX family protein